MRGQRLIVAYDGRAFHGWQRQPGLRTVQGVLEETVHALTGEAVEVRGTGRTDAGVHALGQVAAFDAEVEMPAHGWLRALNGKLPPDVAVREVAPCAPGYDPRFDARGKTYRYLLHVAETPSPLWHERAWHLGPRRARPWPGGRGRRRPRDFLDLRAMRRACDVLRGEHDFQAFRASADTRESTIRRLGEVRLQEGYAGDPEVLALTVRGNAFMQHMVRILAGTLVDVGRQRLTPPQVGDLLGPRASRQDAGETAPPGGLYLVSVRLGRLQQARAQA